MSADGAIHLPPPSVCLPLSTHPATDYLSMIATLTVTLIISLQSQFNQSNKLPSSVFSLSLSLSTPADDVGGARVDVVVEGQNV